MKSTRRYWFQSDRAEMITIYESATPETDRQYPTWMFAGMVHEQATSMKGNEWLRTYLSPPIDPLRSGLSPFT